MTDCDRLLRVLQDGRPHSHSELYGLGMIVHSRVADLRARGHNIVCWKDRVGQDDRGRPVYSYFYRLAGSLDGAASNGAPSSLARGAAPSAAAPLSEPTLDEYGVEKAAANVNDEFPGMLLEEGVPVSVALPIEDARVELAKLQETLWGQAA